MSRIGRVPITVPAGVEVKIEGSNVHVKGPKGELSLNVDPRMTVKYDAGVITVERPSDEQAVANFIAYQKQLQADYEPLLARGGWRRVRRPELDPGKLAAVLADYIAEPSELRLLG